jgi:hypothetical protein
MEFKTKERLDFNDITNILVTLVNRKRFIYRITDIIMYLLSCLCIRSLALRRHDPKVKPHFIFEKCE